MKKLVSILVLVSFAFVAPQVKGQTNISLISDSDIAFLKDVQRAVLTDDIGWLSEVVSYPLVLKLHGGDLRLENKAALKGHAKLILTSHLKLEVQRQSTNSLFINWQGVMLGGGVIWFSEVAEKSESGEKIWRHRIISINPEDRTKSKN